MKRNQEQRKNAEREAREEGLKEKKIRVRKNVSGTWLYE